MPEQTDQKVAVPDSMHLAVEQNRLAYERTLLAWVRTAIAMISFGFTVYKFFQYLHESGQAPPSKSWLTPREFAMLMIAFGLMALCFATVEHRNNVRSLRARYGHVRMSLAGLFAAFVACLGALGFIAVVFRQ